MPNWKSVALALTEILAYNAQTLQGHVSLATPLLPSFDIWGLAAAKRRRLNYEPLQSVHRQRQRSVSTLPLKMHYVGACFGVKWS